MFNNAKEFYTDYKELVVNEKEFCKKHWVGIVVLNVVPVAMLLVAPAVCDMVNQAKNKFKSKKNNEAKEEVESI